MSWESVFEDPSFLYDQLQIQFSPKTDNITDIFEVTVSVTSKYIVTSTYDEYSIYYEGVTENDMLGVTYIVDVNPFDRLLENANNCENRKSSSFVGKHFLTDFWDYTLYPGNTSQLGNDKYLEYGDQNIWDIKMVDGNCNNVRWSHTFTFDELFGGCTNTNGTPAYTVTEIEDEITFATNFYLTLVSPDPLFLTACNNGSADCGKYLTYVLFIRLFILWFLHFPTFWNQQFLLTC